MNFDLDLRLLHNLHCLRKTLFDFLSTSTSKYYKVYTFFKLYINHCPQRNNFNVNTVLLKTEKYFKFLPFTLSIVYRNYTYLKKNTLEFWPPPKNTTQSTLFEENIVWFSHHLDLKILQSLHYFQTIYKSLSTAAQYSWRQRNISNFLLLLWP